MRTCYRISYSELVANSSDLYQPQGVDRGGGGGGGGGWVWGFVKAVNCEVINDRVNCLFAN
jgi:hypothetical protein